MLDFGPFELPFGLVFLGGLFACVGLLVLGEYRKAFLEDPRSVMSFDVLSSIVLNGSSGGLGAALLVVALFCWALALLIIGASCIEYFSQLWSVLFPSPHA